MGKSAKHWTPEIEEIRAWLKQTGVSRAELSVKLGVSRHTVDNYLSGHTPIPARARARILAHKEYIPPQTHPLAERCRVVGAPLTGAEYAEVLSAAMKSNYTVEELCSAAILEYSRAILSGTIKLASPTRTTVQ